MGVYHLVANLVCVLPLLERFEAGHGTLTSLALFFGRECFWASDSLA
jgi:glycosylphosphatidylinositol transamidase